MQKVEKEMKEIDYDQDKIIIFGAGYLAKTILHYLAGMNRLWAVIAIAVTNKKDNPAKLMGLEVRDLTEFTEEKESAIVMLAISEAAQPEAKQELIRHGFEKIFPVTAKTEWHLHKEYQKKIFPKGAICAGLLENLDDIDRIRAQELKTHIYQVRSSADKILEHGDIQADWMKTIYAGAALTQRKVADYTDNVGENISEKNKQYCELTALYWLWKHCEDAYWGICHYRRNFELEKSDIKNISAHQIDVILPVPTRLYTSLEKHYIECHGEKEWNVMKAVLFEKYPEYRALSQKVFHEGTFYEYNMILARKEIMNDYCSWLFDILFEVEKRCGIKEDCYQNRYAGFLAERLLTLYFFFHQERYCMKHSYVTRIF